MADHKPGIQQSESNGWDDEEVHCGDAVFVILKERLPPLALIVIRPSLWESSRDRGEANRDSKLREFRLDLSGSPAVLIRKPTNQGLNLNWNRRPAGSALRNGSPVEPETLSMPADHGVGLNEDPDLSPSRPHPR